MITKSTSAHKNARGKMLRPGHYDLHVGDHIEHFATKQMAMDREKQIEAFKHMEGA